MKSKHAHLIGMVSQLTYPTVFKEKGVRNEREGRAIYRENPPPTP
jgi:hypothetical protein